MELQAYYAESWFTAEGARLKARRLQQAGIPDLRNWRFVTLTVATRKISPYAAYLLGKQRLRRFLARFRKAVGHAFLWCWKLEFHDDGYPHWHLLLEYRKRIPEEMLSRFEDWWGLGRPNVERVKERDIAYIFKYVAKGPEDLPAWVMSHKGRIRVFQSSAGFFTKRKARATVKREPMTCLVPVSLATRNRWDERKALLFEEQRDGTKRVSVVKLPLPFNELLLARARYAIAYRVPLTAPGTVSISQLQTLELRYEHIRWRGLAAIPKHAAAA
jgi:hypothetical protein